MRLRPDASSAVDPAVVLDDVTVRFPRQEGTALRRVRLRVERGEHVVVLGPSGSGKSTLLHVVTGVVPHTVSADLCGQVVLAGTATEQTPVAHRSRHIGVVPQDPGSAVCLPGVLQELALPLENHAVAPERIGHCLDSVLRAVGAGDLRDRATATLSGGESQRVAMAAALVTEPEVLVLDEPTSMLDAAGIASLRGSLATAVARYDPAVLLVEHRLDEWAAGAGAAGLPARAVALDENGTVLADGPTATVLREHAQQLHRAGCWLPLDAELYAVTGAEGGLEALANTDLLRTLGEATLVDDRLRGVSAAPPVLSTHDLVVGRTGRPLLTGIDLTVHHGEIVALLSANGVGKSTLLLTLAGLLAPIQGRVEGDRPGLVFQNPEHQFVAHSVRREIGHGLAAQAAAQVVPQQMRRHRLDHLADQNPFRLSGGEKRRLSLAAMLAHDRACLLADEPTLGLDRRDAIATTRTLRQVASGGSGVVFSSHDVRTVVAVADRAILLGETGVLADGRPTELLVDAHLTARAGITVPPLVNWLWQNLPVDVVPGVLRGLDDLVGRSADATPAVVDP